MAESVANQGLPKRIGRYDVLAYIATGGMAELYLGRDQTAGRPVVIKRILPHLARQAAFVSMFVDEARIGSLVSHRNLVRVFELGQVGTDLFLVMEYLDGENLSGLIRRLVGRNERLAYALAAHVIAEACAGLHAAHELKDEHGKRLHVVHRDVSPQNTFVTYAGEVKVLDFGVASAAHRLTKTETGHIKGKFAYMSPEQCRGESLDARSDVFALGIVLYELSTQRRLFHRAGELMVFKAVCEDPIPKPSREHADYPKCLEEIVMKALSRKIEKRYANAREMRHDLHVAMKQLGFTDDPEGAMKAEMQRLFHDRVSEKVHILKQVRAGSLFERLPSAEVDENIEVPPVSRQSATPPIVKSMSGSASATPSTVGSPARRTRWPWLLALIAIVLGVGAALVIPRLDNETVAAPPDAALSVVAIDAIEPIDAAAVAAIDAVLAAEPEPIAIDVRAVPAGSLVFVDGVLQGLTPMTVRLPHGATPVTLEVRHKGYQSYQQALTPDRDQNFVLNLVEERVVIRKPLPKPKPEKKPDKKGSGFHRFD